ncbi:hypothetical protein CR513_28390, partial [Mucuna pruriens]
MLALKLPPSITEFVNQFERFAGGIWEHLIGTFLNGLKEEMDVEVKLYDTKSLSEMMSKAQKIDVAKVGPYQGSKGGSTFRCYLGNKIVTTEPTIHSQRRKQPKLAKRTKLQKADTSRNARELQKGECLRCEERYNPSHVCKSRMEEPGALSSLSSILNLTNRRSLKDVSGLWSYTYNFISIELVEKLKLPITKIPYFVKVGDQHKIKCSKGELVGARCTDSTKQFLFGLGGVDVVLGLEWLAGLGEIRANFDDLTLQVNIGGEKKLIRDKPKLIKSAMSLNSVKEALKDQAQEFLLGCYMVEQPELDHKVPTVSSGGVT